MRKTIFAVAGLVALGITVYGQAQSDAGVSLSLTADSIDRRPINGYDGIVRPGPAEYVTTAIGNVVIIVNGVRVTTDQAAWHSGSNVIELGRNSVARIDLPGRVTSLRIGTHR